MLGLRTFVRYIADDQMTRRRDVHAHTWKFSSFNYFYPTDKRHVVIYYEFHNLNDTFLMSTDIQKKVQIRSFSLFLFLVCKSQIYNYT